MSCFDTVLCVSASCHVRRSPVAFRQQTASVRFVSRLLRRLAALGCCVDGRQYGRLEPPAHLPPHAHVTQPGRHHVQWRRHRWLLQESRRRASHSMVPGEFNCSTQSPYKSAFLSRLDSLQTTLSCPVKQMCKINRADMCFSGFAELYCVAGLFVCYKILLRHEIPYGLKVTPFECL